MLKLVKSSYKRVLSGAKSSWWKSDITIGFTGVVVGLSISLILLRGFLFSPGIARYWDLQWWYSSNLCPTYLWDEYLQAPTIFNRILAYLPLSIFPAEASQRLLYIFIFTTMGMSMFYAVYKLTAPRHATFKVPFIAGTLAALLFIMNPIVTTQVWSWEVMWFYAFMPLLLYSSYSAFSKINYLGLDEIFKRAAIVSFILFVMSVEPRMPLYMPLLPLAFIAGLSRPYWRYLKRSALMVGMMVALYTIFCSCWIFPTASGADVVPYWYVNSHGYVYAATKLSSCSLFNAFSLRVFPADFQPIFSHTGLLESLWKIAVIAVPVIAFGVILFKRSKLIIWLMLFSMAMIFLSKGTSTPFSGFYEWLTFDSPLSAFGYQIRKPYLWMDTLMVCYALLFGLSTSYLLGWIKDKVKWTGIRLPLLGFLVLVLLSVPLLAGHPLLTGDVNGTMKPDELSNNWVDFNTWMEDEPEDFKIVYCPRPLALGSPKPTQPHYYSGTRPSHSPLLPVFLMRSLASGNTLRFGELQTPWNARYVTIWSNAYNTPQDDLELEKQFGSIYVYQNTESCSEIESTRQLVVVVGGLESTLSLAAVDSYDMVNSSLLFVDQLVGNGDYIANADVVISNLGSLDLYLSLLEEDYVIEVMNACDDGGSHGYAKATAENLKFADWHYYLHNAGLENWQYDYGKGFARSNGRSYLELPFDVDSRGDYIILIRAFQNKNGNVLRISLDGEIANEVPTKSHLNQFRWIEVGAFNLSEGKHILSVEQVVSGWETVNLLAVLPLGELQEYESQIDDMLSDKRIVSIWEAEAALDSSNTVVSDKYGSMASGGRILEMPSGSQAWRNMEVVVDSEYILAARVNGSGVVKIDEQFYPVSSPELNYTYLGPLYLERGEYSVEINPVEGQLDLDVIWLYTVEEEDEIVDDIFVTEDESAHVIDFVKVNPTKYRVEVSATQPFMLSFSEAYDRLWVARVNGREYHSVPLNSVVNGFWIEDTGTLEITVEFKPQMWFYWGTVVSVIGQVGVLAFILWNWRRKRK